MMIYRYLPRLFCKGPLMAYAPEVQPPTVKSILTQHDRHQRDLPLDLVDHILG